MNASAAVKAESEICCTSSNARRIVESLGIARVIMLPDKDLTLNVAKETGMKVITWAGHCEVHVTRPRDQTIRKSTRTLRADNKVGRRVWWSRWMAPSVSSLGEIPKPSPLKRLVEIC